MMVFNGDYERLIQPFTRLVLAGCAIFSAWIAVRALRRNIRAQKTAKMADILISTTQRFDKLYSDYRKIDFSKQLSEDDKSVMRRFWSMQYEQFQYFKYGLIDIEIMTYWMRLRNREHNEILENAHASYKEILFEIIEYFSLKPSELFLKNYVLNKSLINSEDISKVLRTLQKDRFE